MALLHTGEGGSTPPRRSFDGETPVPLSPEEHQAQLNEALRLWRAGLHTEARALYAATCVTQGGRYSANRAAAFFRDHLALLHQRRPVGR